MHIERVVESIKHFIDCVGNDKTPYATGEDGLAVTRILCALLDSMEARVPVEVDYAH